LLGGVYVANIPRTILMTSVDQLADEHQ
jgi:hypothetical protein